LLGLTVKFGALLTVNVTATVCGLFDAPVALIVTVPV
jgi:hypothetical protein